MAPGIEPHGVTALCPLVRTLILSLVLVQPRKTSPFLTERLLMERKESNQTKTKLYLGNSPHISRAMKAEKYGLKVIFNDFF